MYIIIFSGVVVSRKSRPIVPPNRDCGARPTLTPQPSYACAATGQKHSPSFGGGGGGSGD